MRVRVDKRVWVALWDLAAGSFAVYAILTFYKHRQLWWLLLVALFLLALPFIVEGVKRVRHHRRGNNDARS